MGGMRTMKAWLSAHYISVDNKNNNKNDENNYSDNHDVDDNNDN